MRQIIISGILLILMCGMVAPARAQDEDEIMKHQPPRDYGHDWALGVLFGLTPEDGALLGARPILYEFDFRRLPYIYRMELLGGGTLSASIPTNHS